MKRLLLISLMSAAGWAAADGNPCREPEYYFLKNASKSEMRDEYCSLSRRAESNAKDREITREAIQKKHSLHLDTSVDREQEMGELKAATSCRVAAGAIADALSRRFKSKPPFCN